MDACRNVMDGGSWASYGNSIEMALWTAVVGTAATLGVSLRALQSMNDVDPKALRPGMWLEIPAAKRGKASSKGGIGRAKTSSSPARSASVKPTDPAQSGRGGASKASGAPRTPAK